MVILFHLSNRCFLAWSALSGREPTTHCSTSNMAWPVICVFMK